jgi:hypothetical protein
MDFSEYTGPSEEWIALEKTLPTTTPNLTTEQLKDVTNKDREDVAAREMVEQGTPPTLTSLFTLLHFKPN